MTQILLPVNLERCTYLVYVCDVQKSTCYHGAVMQPFINKKLGGNQEMATFLKVPLI